LTVLAKLSPEIRRLKAVLDSCDYIASTFKTDGLGFNFA
jgi:hypothetical protein